MNTTGKKKKILPCHIAAIHCQVMPSMLQLISHTISARSSSEAVLEHLVGAQSLSAHTGDRLLPLHAVLYFNECVMRLNKVHTNVQRILIKSAGSGFYQRGAGTRNALAQSVIRAELLFVPEVAPTLAVQVWLHSTVDGGLRPLHCRLGENAEDLHCHLDDLVLVPPQVRLHHPRVQREHAHPCACKTLTSTCTVKHLLHLKTTDSGTLQS